VIVEAENGGGIECIREGWRRYLDNDWKGIVIFGEPKYPG
jgi:hypothetical protein